MKIKKLIGTAVAAALLSFASAGASATTIDAPDDVSGSSFTDWLIGTITISTLSNLTGYFYAADSISTTNPKTGAVRVRSLDGVSFSSGSVGELVGTWNSATASFTYLNVGPGVYTVKASGTLDGLGQISQTAFLSADYTVTAVPEPESYAMLLAGLGLMGTIARRRSKAATA